MSGGEIAALVAAGAFLLLVGILAVPLLKLGRTVDAATESINRLTDRTDPILAELHISTQGLNQTLVGVNAQLDKVDTITEHAQNVTGSVSTLTSIFTNAVGGPLIRIAGLAYGIRQAIQARRSAAGRHSA